jgi:hypothetical protein
MAKGKEYLVLHPAKTGLPAATSCASVNCDLAIVTTETLLPEHGAQGRT